EYSDESDPEPYPIPTNAPIEGGSGSDGDRHVLVLEEETCKLYELWSAYPNDDGSWRAGAGAVFDLRSHALRPDGWASANAAGAGGGALGQRGGAAGGAGVGALRRVGGGRDQAPPALQPPVSGEPLPLARPPQSGAAQLPIGAASRDAGGADGPALSAQNQF